MGGREFWLVKLNFNDKEKHIIEFAELSWAVEHTELRFENDQPVAYILLSQSTEETSLRSRIMDAPRIHP